MSLVFDIIIPVRDSRDNIIDWRIAARVRVPATSADPTLTAIKFARDNYGLTADIRPATF
jgi:hypothetical protein